MLETTWFVIWGVLWAIYFMLDGFDLGMGTLLPFITENETERRTIYNAAGPFWDGNEVWLITAGGVTFAAFPKAYAVMFSALYAPLLILLFALIFRAVSFEFRNKIDSDAWRRTWDVFQFLGSFVPALLLGVAFANLFMGIPIDADGVYHGTLFTLLNPYGLLGGVLFVLMFALHGALWLAVKSSGKIHDRAIATARALWPYLLTAAIAFLAATGVYTDLYDNYFSVPPLLAILFLAVAMLVTTRFFIHGESAGMAWVCSSVTIVCVTMFGVLGMYPALIPSSIDPAFSVTIANAASSPLTLKIMLGVSLSCVPVVIGYQAWVFSVFSFKITDKDLESPHAY